MYKITIRLAEERDLEALCDLYIDFHQFHAQHLPTYLRSLDDFSAKEREELKGRIMEILHGRDSAILVADRAGHVIGMAEVYLRHSDPENRATARLNYAHLQSLMVTQMFRNQGIGSQLIQAVESWARENEASELRLEIWEFQAGPLDFYEKLGYQTLRRTLVKRFSLL